MQLKKKKKTLLGFHIEYRIHQGGEVMNDLWIHLRYRKYYRKKCVETKRCLTFK